MSAAGHEEGCARGRWPARVAQIAGASLLAFVLVACGTSSRESAGRRRAHGSVLHGIVVTPPPAVGALSLPDRSRGGAPLPFAAAAGDILLVYFGYTSCPDICPTTLADLQAAVKHLGTDGRRVQVAMVTIDPRRDTPTVLRAYLTHFFPSGHPLQTDDAARLQAVADGFGARYDVTVAANGTEDVGHTAFVYAVDPEGRVVDTWPFGTDSSVVTHDLRILLRRVRGEASTSSREGSSS